MEELLREFCELAPKEWRCKFKDVCVRFHPPAHPRFNWVEVYLYDDSLSANALVVLLDWLEGRGWHWEIANYQPPGTYRCSSYRSGFIMPQADGKTRIEAVLRACVSVLRVQEEEEK